MNDQDLCNLWDKISVNRHLGCFAVSVELLDKMPDVLMRDVFSKVLIIRAEHMLDRNVIMYVAYSPEYFSLVPEGSMAPLYMLQIDKYGDLSMVKAE